MQSPVCSYHLAFVSANADVHVQTSVCTSALKMWESSLRHSLRTVSSPVQLKNLIMPIPSLPRTKGFKETHEPTFFLEDVSHVAKKY